MRFGPRLPPGWLRVAGALAVVFLLATAGTVAVGATLSTTVGYAVDVGPAVSEVPAGATVVEGDRAPDGLRDQLDAIAREDISGLLVDEFPVESTGGPVYLTHGGLYYALDVTPQRALTTAGRLGLGVVYLLSLLLGISAPARAGRWTL